MGKQTAIALTENDEHVFLKFLKEIAEIEISISFAPTIKGLWVNDFIPNESIFSIWNKAYEWTPIYGQVTGDKTGIRQGYYYISNKGTAPIIEYTRHEFDKPKGLYGRIYWTKDFAAPNGLSYDIESFDKWYKTIVSWIRKYGKKITHETLSPYYFPDALNQLENPNKKMHPIA